MSVAVVISATPREFRDHWGQLEMFTWSLTSLLSQKKPGDIARRSANMANFGPPGTSVGSRIVLPRSFFRSLKCCSQIFDLCVYGNPLIRAQLPDC